MRGMILRTYAGFARGVHFASPRYTDELMFADIGAAIEGGLLARCMVSVDVNEQLRKQVWERWGDEGLTRFDRAGGFDKPSRLQNLAYSYALQRMFGADELSALPEFTATGIFRLADGYGFYVPQREGRSVTELRFFRYSALRPDRSKNG